jgi:hypothetical protein
VCFSCFLFSFGSAVWDAGIHGSVYLSFFFLFFLLYMFSVLMVSRMVRFGFGNGAVLFMGSSFIML